MPKIKYVSKKLMQNTTGSAGVTVYPYIFIRRDFEGDTALVKHETVHWHQQKRIGTAKFLLKYATSKTFRLDMEVEAYKESIKYGESSVFCARELSENYRLGITFDEALALLTA